MIYLWDEEKIRMRLRWVQRLLVNCKQFYLVSEENCYYKNSKNKTKQKNMKFKKCTNAFITHGLWSVSVWGRQVVAVGDDVIIVVYSQCERKETNQKHLWCVKTLLGCESWIGHFCKTYALKNPINYSISNNAPPDIPPTARWGSLTPG